MNIGVFKYFVGLSPCAHEHRCIQIFCGLVLPHDRLEFRSGRNCSSASPSNVNRLIAEYARSVACEDSNAVGFLVLEGSQLLWVAFLCGSYFIQQKSVAIQGVTVRPGWLGHV